ncbi:hypothetical protein VPHF99_0183 [Vibrio phage F99]
MFTVVETIGSRSMLPENKYVFTKVYRTYFCPDCNRNVFGKYLR